MMRRTLFFLAPFVVAATVLAQHQTLTVNPGASEVKFLLKGIHETQGGFHVDKGVVHFDRSSPKVDGLIVVAAGSGDTGSDGRNKRMKDEVLEVAHFATITFAPASYQGSIAATGDSTIQVTGIFTLHGTPHEITVPMQLHIEGTRCTAKAHLVVPYVKWGLKDPSILFLKVEKDVEVDLTLAGILSVAP